MALGYYTRSVADERYHYGSRYHFQRSAEVRREIPVLAILIRVYIFAPATSVQPVPRLEV
jgi:hypothetical protein